MVSPHQTRDGVRGAVVERLSWQPATRNDAAVAAVVAAGAEVDAVHTLEEVGLLDAWYHYLDEIGVVDLLDGVEIPAIQRMFMPVTQFVLLYLLKVLFGIESMNALPPLLFSNVAAMQVVGFNAHQVADGLTRRGDDRRTQKRKAGPLTPATLANNISKLTTEEVTWFFNRVVQQIAAAGHLRGDLTVALDGSKLPTPASYPGCGHVVEREMVWQPRLGKAVTVERTVYGWKVLVLIDVATRLPLAVKVVTIQAYEGAWLVPLLEQAQENLGDHARITTMVVDRGYLDGEDLWTVHERGLTFVIVAKAGMAVRADAQALAREGPTAGRVRTVRHGHGRTATTETKTTRLVGVTGVTTYDAYGPPDHTRHRNQKDFDGKPLNAVVVQMWDNHDAGDTGLVYLTNGPVTDPFIAFDTYDLRSVIENGIFKEGKYPWHLGRFPRRTEAGVIVHVFLTLATMALCTAFRLWQAEEATTTPAPMPTPTPRPSSRAPQRPALGSIRLGGEGATRWRRRLQEQNRDHVIVFVGAAYGIFHVAAYSVLSGVRLKTLPPELGSRDDIFARYNLRL